MSLPRDILERSERVMDYHRASRLEESTKVPPLDLNSRPPTAHIFDYANKTPLSSKLLDAPTPMLTLLEQGLEAVPDSLHQPPQDLRTLSTWLHLAAGLRQRVAMPFGPAMVRAVPSADMSYPGEIYVAAFAIEGLPPGLHHYSVKEHALRHLRDAPETLALLRRGRPDLHYLATVPCALLVSTVFCRSTWSQGRRGYRQAILDCGHLVENLHAVAVGLGMNTVTRLRMTDSSMQELLGIPADADYAHAEAVQAMVVWADGATKPLPIASHPNTTELGTFPRPSCEGVVPFGSVLAVHHDVASTGVAIREIRPPMTDLTPVPAGVAMARFPVSSDLATGKSMRLVSLASVYTESFQPRSISRDLIVRFARCAFRSGTYFPLKPDGPHVALVRPFWVVQEVTGQDPGIWYYDPVIDKWAHLNHGQYRQETTHFTRERSMLAGASVLCVMVANVRKLLSEAGPDLYRLALMEAGIAAQRLNLASVSVGLGCRTFGDFNDDSWKNFLGLGNTGWDSLAVCAIGGLPGTAAKQAEAAAGTLEFRD